VDLPELVRLALAEDVGPGDVTTEAVVPAAALGEGTIETREELVVCGHEPAKEVFRQLGARYVGAVDEGTLVGPGSVVARVAGPLRAVLTGERVALNFLMRLSGIATHARRAVSAAGGLRVVDTRKTTPLHRALERHAVRVGGASNHRFALYDGVLVKDNHVAAAGSVAEAVGRARENVHHLHKIEVEVSNLDELSEALAAGADVVLLDNMNDQDLAEAVRIGGGRAMLEASGGITPERLPGLAGLGLDLVSMGGLVHGARWVDLSLAVRP
jgi:nicotinate-nucleotide pyrophosphorylase (carboxylating)